MRQFFTVKERSEDEPPDLEFRVNLDEDGDACLEASIRGMDDWDILCFVQADTGKLTLGYGCSARLGLDLDNNGRIRCSNPSED